MTFQRKLLFGFSIMVLPALLVGAEAIRSNRLERRALDALGQSMARTRTYAELETAMFDQSEVIWRYLSGMDSTAAKEFQLAGEVVDYWEQRWRAELKPEERELADGVAALQRQIRAAGRQHHRACPRRGTGRAPTASRRASSRDGCSPRSPR